MSPQRVVLDTNVLVSALINSFGPPGRVLDLALAGELTTVYDDRILAEWRNVLHREKFEFPKRAVEALLDLLGDEGLAINAPPLVTDLPDIDDAPFIEVAHHTEAILITGNLKHYPQESRHGVEVIEPATFLREWSS